MKALILAAGYATRLYPLTENKPKALLEVHGKPIITHLIEKLQGIPQIDQIYVVTNKKFYDTFVGWRDTAVSDTPITIINDGTDQNGKRLGSVGDIDFVIEEKNIEDDLLVFASDNFFSFSIHDFISFFEQKKSTIVAVYDTKDTNRITNKLGCVDTNTDHKMLDFVEKPAEPKSTLAATCCYIFPKEDLQWIEEAIHQNLFDRAGDLISFILSKKEVYAFEFDGYWYDIGCYEEYNMVNSDGVEL
jgi:glucose-1-phosphate thymidylyltransferase